MADREDRDRKKFALLKTIFNARRQWQLMQQSILNHCIARWRLILKVCAFTLLLLSFHESKKDVVRSYRRLGRNEGWWNNVWNTYSERRFQKTFRISKDTFQFILSGIRHDLERDDMRLGMSLSSWTRWLLLYNSRMAGVGVSTVSTITQDVCEAKEYRNFKNFYSVVLMGMVDAKYKFIWASCGYPGNSHDSLIM